MNDKDLSKIRGVIKEEIETALKPVKETLGEHTRILGEHTDKLDSLTADVMDLQDQVRVLDDKIGLYHGRNIGLPLIPDTPEV